MKARATLAALLTWSPSAVAVAGAAAQWNAYIVAFLALCGFVLTLTLALILDDQLAKGGGL